MLSLSHQRLCSQFSLHPRRPRCSVWHIKSSSGKKVSLYAVMSLSKKVLPFSFPYSGPGKYEGNFFRPSVAMPQLLLGDTGLLCIAIRTKGRRQCFRQEKASRCSQSWECSQVMIGLYGWRLNYCQDSIYNLVLRSFDHSFWFYFNIADV